MLFRYVERKRADILLISANDALKKAADEACVYFILIIPICQLGFLIAGKAAD